MWAASPTSFSIHSIAALAVTVAILAALEHELGVAHGAHVGERVPEARVHEREHLAGVTRAAIVRTPKRRPWFLPNYGGARPPRPERVFRK